MSFNSIEYILFLPAVLCVYWLLPHRFQNLFLVFASYYFLCYVHPVFGLLIFAVTSINYLCALAISHRQKHKKLFLLAAIGCCLLNLGYFKYASFFIDNFEYIFNLLGLYFSKPVLSIVLPVGISFYTFQALAYTIDVYRGQKLVVTNFIEFSLFISFFPQLVAGPIERSKDLLPQIQSKRSVTPEIVQQGIMLLMWGFFKKLVIADNTGLITYKVFSLAEPGFFLLWSGVFSFGIQILADFWSYTDMARGSALLLGFKLSRNFNHPYLSTSPADFWRKWHMSLSYWLRDYVYIPLGGSQANSTLRKSFNILITFLISGLWHGASWNFILWGGYQGILVLLDRFFRKPVEVLERILPSFFTHWFLGCKILITFICINAGWLFFRETDLERIVYYLRLSPFEGSADSPIALYFFCLSFLYSLPIFIHGVIHNFDKKIRGKQRNYPKILLLFRPLVAAALLLAILTLRSPEPSTFIYFQF